MLKDEEIDELIQPIINLYSHIEEDLIVEIAKRFENANEVKGSLEWQLKKLDELGGVNASLVKVIREYTGKNEETIKNMLSAAGYANIDYDVLQTAFEMGVAKITPDILMKSEPIANIINLSYKSLKDTFSLINTRAIESAKQNYLNIINTAYLDSATGIHSLQESVKNGIAQMAKNGFDGATYIRQGRIVKYSIEGVVRRDTLTAVHKLANQVSEKACEELGAEYVEISQHLGARTHPTNPIANHAGWQGKVFKVNGSDDKYPNLRESTGYPDDILGLGGVNCRHRMFPFFPGISIPNPIMYSEKENEKAYKATQGQRRLEREIRKLKKEKAAMKAIGDNDAVKAIDYKLQQKFTQIDNYCDARNLKRDYSRELVSEQIVKNLKGKSAGNSANTKESNLPKLIKTVDFNDKNAIINVLNEFEKHAVKLPYEVNCTVTSDGKVWGLKGSEGFVEAELVETVGGSSLKGSYSYHNHPKESTYHSFSGFDVGFFLENKEEYAKASDYKYSYVMKRQKDTLPARYDDIIAEFNKKIKKDVYELAVSDTSFNIDENGYHEVMKILADKYNFFYERTKNG